MIHNEANENDIIEARGIQERTALVRAGLESLIARAAPARSQAPSVMAFLRLPIVLTLVAVFGICPFMRAASPAASKAPVIADADLIVRELCGKRVAMLGESPLHGFGKTLEFKAGLVRRLIDECHYNAFFIESGIYDFLNIQKKLKSGQEVTEPMIAAAIGGLWATREVQPLIPFLLERMKAGSVTMGGLDDQLGRGTYAQREMSSDLVQHLQGDEKAGCLAILQKHTLWQYSDDFPYSPKDKALILGCLDRIEASLSTQPVSKAVFRGYDMAMIDSLKRSFARDFRQDVPKGGDTTILDGNDRDRSMYLNFRWLLSRLTAHRKVIVWAATTHVAKDLSGVSGKESVVPFGCYVRREYRGRAFALGFSAYSGSYAMTGQPVRQLSNAPSDSLEGHVLAGRDLDTDYLSLRELRKFGSVPARPLGSTFRTARWSEVLDGLLIFREEHAPEFVRR